MIKPPTCAPCNKIPFWGSCWPAYLILFSLPVIIMLYWLLLQLRYGKDNVVNNDPLNVKVMDIAFIEGGSSSWVITHYMVFLVLGILFPQCWIPAITLGIVWEIIESFNGYMFKGTYQAIRQTTGSNIQYKSWWGPSVGDVFANIFGFITGMAIRNWWDYMRSKNIATK